MSDNTSNKTRSGYRVDNLGLPVWLVNKLKEDYPESSIHFAIQAVLKAAYSEAK